jgi:hypothetical protein
MLRWTVISCLLLAAFPLLAIVQTGDAPGAGPDVVSTLWGMWWFQQSWAGAAWSGWTDLVNHPHGAWGTVLSPSSAITWSLMEPVMGPGRASALVSCLQVGGLALATAWLGRVAGLSEAGVWVAALSVLVGRLLVFGLGEGSVVAIAALPIPIGLVALLKLYRCEAFDQSGPWIALSMACMGWTAIENPYLAPVLPAVALVLAGTTGLSWYRSEDERSVQMASLVRQSIALLLGIASIGLVAWMFSRSASPDYPREVAGETASLLGMGFDIVDLEHARSRPDEWFIPGDVQWTLDAEGATEATGGRYLGLSVWILALLGVVLDRKRTWPWAVLALGCLALSVGSVVYGVGGVFLYLNALMSWVARPLTQPTRFLIVALIALSVLAGFGLDALRSRLSSRAGAVLGSALALLGLDFLVLGGGSLEIPSTPIPNGSCLKDLDGEGAVMVWPWDAQDGELGRSQLLQIVHQRPAAHTGIASWQLEDQQVTTELRNGGLNTLGAANKRFNINHFQDRGYRYLVVESEVLPEAQAWLEEQLEAPIGSCDGLRIFDLGTPEDRAPPEDSPPADGPPLDTTTQD